MDTGQWKQYRLRFDEQQEKDKKGKRKHQQAILTHHRDRFGEKVGCLMHNIPRRKYEEHQSTNETDNAGSHGPRERYACSIENIKMPDTPSLKWRNSSNT